MENKKETVILFRGQIESLLSLNSLKDVKTILRAIVQYGMDNETPEIPDHLTFGWLWFKNTIDAHREQYNARCDKNRSNAKKRWDANGCDGIRSDANDADKDNDKDNDFLERDNAPAHSEKSSELMIAAEEIAKIYPKAKVGDFRALIEAVASAIGREITEVGRDLHEAIATVKTGTTEYAEAVQLWKDKSFISTPEKFYNSGMYNHDPETFKREAKGISDNSKRKRFDPADPTTWPTE